MKAAISNNSNDLKRFGLVVGGIFLTVFGLLIPFARNRTIAPMYLVIGGTLLFLAQFRPTLLKYAYLLWMKVGSVLGWINTRIILSFVFFVVILPIGLLMKLSGADPLVKKRKSDNTYRIPSKEGGRMERMF